MPVYNTDSSELITAIESVLNQTFCDFEFIILNDGSTNDSEEIILSFKDERIKYHKNEENLKLIATLNKGLDLAQGKYIARLDSDDYCDAFRFEKQIKVMESDSAIGLCGTCFTKIPSGKRPIIPDDSNDINLVQRYMYNALLHSAVMFKKEIIIKNNLRYNKNILHAEDYKLWIDMSYVCKIVNINEYLVYYRESNTGISQKNLRYQQKMVEFLKLSCMIRDFGHDKKYLNSLLLKFAAGKKFFSREYETLSLLLKHVENYLNQNLSEPFKKYIKEYINAPLCHINIDKN